MCFEPASRSTLDDDDAEEAAFICDSITKEDPTNAHRAQHRPKPRVRLFHLYIGPQTELLKRLDELHSR